MTNSTAASTVFVEALTAQGLGSLVIGAENPEYAARIETHYSRRAHKRPLALVQPRHTDDVAAVIKLLAAHPNVPFAVRSGGHLPWGGSNVDDGVCLDLGAHLKTVSLDKERGVVSIGAGALWRDVYEHIEGTGFVVAGGRAGSVGVGGFLAGGGLSWHAGRVGFGCDTVEAAEVVLASGRVVEARADNEHVDLWRAVRGAGTAANFGVVTRFDMRALHDDGFWGGFLVSAWTPERTADHVAVMRRFTDALEKNPDSTYTTIWGRDPEKGLHITAIGGNTRGVADAPELAELAAIPTVYRDMKHRSLMDITCGAELSRGYYTFWHTTTFANDERIMTKVVQLHAAAVAKIEAASQTGDFRTICLMQALPAFYERLGAERGGNSTGLDLQGRNAVLLLFSVDVSEEALQDLALETTRDWLRGIEDYARSVDGYVPWKYVNYADKAQDPIATLRDPTDLKETARKYDPEGFFQTRMPGGFKISSFK